MITIQSGKMIIPEEERFVGFAGDDHSISKQFILPDESDTGCSYTLYLRFDDDRVTSAALTAESGDDGLILTWDVRARNLLKSGIVMAQLRIADGDDEIVHTSWDYFVVGACAELADDGGEVDVLHRTEFEERLAQVSAAKVDKTLTIAGADLQDDITAAELKAALSVPTKTSDLTNDSGFLTQHQDISGKADKATTLSGYGVTDAYTKNEADARYLQSHQDISGKADKATTLSGYGITNAYTKTQVDGMIPTYTSDLTNDSGFLTQHQDISGKMDRYVELSSDDTSSLSKGQVFYYGTHYYIKSSLATPVGAQHEIADPSDIPTKTSELTNDSGFLTLNDLPVYNGGVQ